MTNVFPRSAIIADNESDKPDAAHACQIMVVQGSGNTPRFYIGSGSAWIKLVTIESDAGVTSAGTTVVADSGIIGGWIIQKDKLRSGGIELNPDTPAIIIRDETNTVVFHAGDIDGEYGISGSYYGIGIGDYSGGNYLRYDTDGGFLISAGSNDTTIDEDGIGITFGSDKSNSINWYSGVHHQAYIYAQLESLYPTLNIIVPDSLASDQKGSIIYLETQMYSASGYGVGSSLKLDSDNELATIVGDLKVDDGPTSDGDVIVYGGIYVGSNNDPAEGQIVIDQGSSDIDQIVLVSSDVDDIMGNGDNRYSSFSKVQDTSGGLNIKGYKDSDGINAVAIAIAGYLDENAQTSASMSTSKRGIVEIQGWQTSGSATANTVADGLVLSVMTKRGGSNVTVMAVDEDGDIHYDGSTSSYDEYNDPLMARDLGHVLSDQYTKVIEHNREHFEKLGIVGPKDKDGRFFVSRKKLDALTLGAIGQLYYALEEEKTKVNRLESLIENSLLE